MPLPGRGEGSQQPAATERTVGGAASQSRLHSGSAVLGASYRGVRGLGTGGMIYSCFYTLRVLLVGILNKSRTMWGLWSDFWKLPDGDTVAQLWVLIWLGVGAVIWG